VAAGSNIYWYQGNRKATTSAITATIPSPVANTLYFFYFDDASGTMKAGGGAVNLFSQVPVAFVFWNGTNGAVFDETHDYRRDLSWHNWAHLTVGTRYYSGLAHVLPNAANDDSLQINSGVIYDEEHGVAVTQQTVMRGWYQVSSGVYTFVDYGTPYLGTSGQPQYLNTFTYTLTNVGTNQYVSYWVYATTDTGRPIHVIPTQGVAPYSNLRDARAADPPSLSGLNMQPEMKLIYKFIYRGNGEYQEAVDYRMSSSLPAGGLSATNAQAVSFTPYGVMTATNVQAAMEQLFDYCKSWHSSPSATPSTSISSSPSATPSASPSSSPS
jgi:hypothetical protein